MTMHQMQTVRKLTWTMNVLPPKPGVRPTIDMYSAQLTNISKPWKTPCS